MTEKSIFWTTGGAGDSASEYTMAELIRWLRQTYLSDNTDEGVLLNYGGELAVSGTATPVDIASGGALVYGFPYWSTAASTLAIPTPSGDTRIDRVVLEVNWTAQLVRIACVAGVEGAGAPALTQNAGVTWQVSLAQASITTGGVITVTDEREFIHPNWEVEAGQFNADVVGNAVELSGGALAMTVDDSTIETNADNLRAKANGLDNTYFADRTRDLFVPATEGYNNTGVNYINQIWKGWEMVDNALCECWGVFRVPSDWVSGVSLQAYVIPGGTGNGYTRMSAQFGAVGEDYDTHTRQQVTWSTRAWTANEIEQLNDLGALSLTSLAAGDIVQVKVARDATDVLDTVGATVYFLGFVFTYTADM